MGRKRKRPNSPVMGRPRPELVLRVLNEIVRHCYETNSDECPTARQLAIRLGYTGYHNVTYAMTILEHVGIIKFERKRFKRAKLLLPIRRPVRIPIVGVLNQPSPFTPGSRWIEIHHDYTITVDGQPYTIVELPCDIAPSANNT